MTLGLYSIQDVKTSYIGVTTGVSDDDAMRSFEFAINQNPIWSRYRRDYRLCRLGEFDMDTGKIKGLPSPKVLMDGAQIIERSEDHVEVDK